MKPAAIVARHGAALEKRRALEPVWQACYDHAHPPPAGGPPCSTPRPPTRPNSSPRRSWQN